MMNRISPEREQRAISIGISLSPFIKAAKVLGMAPYRYDFREETTFSSCPQRLKISRFGLFYCLLTFVILLSEMGYNIGWEVAHGFPTIKGVPARTINVGLVTLTFTTILWAIISNITSHRHKYNLILHKMSETAEVLLGEKLEDKYKFVNRLLRAELTFFFIVLSVLYLTGGYVWGFRSAQYYYIGQFHGHLLSCMVNLQFVNIVLAIKHQFHLINEHLEAYLESWENHHIAFSSVIARCISSDTFQERRKFRRKRVAINTLRLSHNTLCQIITTTNAIYGFPVLMQLTYFFMCLIYDVYQVMGLLSDSASENTFEVATYLLWDLVHLSHLVAIAGSCHAASAEAEKPGQTLTRIRLLFPTGSRATKQFSLFSFQLFHAKMHFSAAGILPLNLGLLSGFAGTATTYLVIVLQSRD